MSAPTRGSQLRTLHAEIEQGLGAAGRLREKGEEEIVVGGTPADDDALASRRDPVVRTDDKARMEGPGPQALAETTEHTCAEAHEMLADSWQVFAWRFYPDS